MSFVFWLVVLAAMVFAVVDIITRDDGQIRFMPKFMWLILVILLPLLGVILWFALGREHAERRARPERPARSPRGAHRARTARHEASIPQTPSRPRDPRTTEQQLADLEREIEEERLRAELRRRRQSGDQPPAGSSAP